MDLLQECLHPRSTYTEDVLAAVGVSHLRTLDAFCEHFVNKTELAANAPSLFRYTARDELEQQEISDLLGHVWQRAKKIIMDKRKAEREAFRKEAEARRVAEKEVERSKLEATKAL